MEDVATLMVAQQQILKTYGWCLVEALHLWLILWLMSEGRHITLALLDCMAEILIDVNVELLKFQKHVFDCSDLFVQTLRAVHSILTLHAGFGGNTISFRCRRY
jgi:hypothetical protein